jgi:phosphoesterase RecJ-like protein
MVKTKRIRVRADIAKARKMLEQAESITIIGHQRPDGDAIGSLLALTSSLENSNKRIKPVLVDGIPGRFRFLPGSDRVEKTLPEESDLFVVVDCSDLERMGLSGDGLPRKPDINIDHHPTNTNFAVVNLVDPNAAATSEMIFNLAPQLGLPLDTDVATNLLAGIVTDTIGFRTSNVTSKVLEVAAQLIKLGAPLAMIYEQTLNLRSFVAARYWGSGLSNLEHENGLAWATLTLEDRKLVGYPGKDDADLINLLTTIEGMEVVLVFVEQKEEQVKISLRSKGKVNVADLAVFFGGGGHDQAAGAIISGEIEEVKSKVLGEVRKALRRVMEMGI